jgi:hypothetical protein
VIAAEEFWYQGNYEEYRNLPWLHDSNTIALMPWKVLDVVPFGYIVFLSAGGTKFKMLHNPIVVVGDIIS